MILEREPVHAKPSEAADAALVSFIVSQANGCFTPPFWLKYPRYCSFSFTIYLLKLFMQSLRVNDYNY